MKSRFYTHRSDIRQSVLYRFHYWCHHKFFMGEYFQYYSRGEESCLKEGVRQTVLPKSGWILYTFFKVHRHFGVFFVYSHFNLPVSLPAAGCRLNRVADEWYPLTGSSQSLLSWWHRDTKCKPSARQADYYRAAAERAERRSCTVENEREEKSAD